MPVPWASGACISWLGATTTNESKGQIRLSVLVFFPLPKSARICSFHTFSGYLFRVAFPARMVLLREERVTGYRKVVMTSGVDFFGL